MSFEGDLSKVVNIARSQIGVVERPVNKTLYGEWFGWNGVPWCAIFVSWVFDRAGKRIPPLQTPKGCAYVPTFVQHAKATGQWRPRGTYTPKAGDLIVFQFTNRPDHIGIVQGVLPDGRIHTVEGNTNAAGSRTGGMVAQLYRRSGILGFIDVRPTAPQIDWNAIRRWSAGIVLNKLQAVRTPLDANGWSEDIKTLQEALNIVQNAGLTVDGVYGPATFLNVAGYQSFRQNHYLRSSKFSRSFSKKSVG